MRFARYFHSFAVALACFAAAAVHADPKPDWTVVNLGVLPGSESSRGLGVNNRGDVAGNSSQRVGCCSSRSYPTLWQNGLMMDLTPPGEAVAGSAIAVAVNEKGTVLFQLDAQRLYMWSDGVATRLPFSGVLHDLNDRDEAVGSFQLGFSEHAFLFREGVLHDLGTLGGTRSDAFAVNKHGIVVGVARTANFANRAFVFQDGAMRNIDTMGGFSSAAQDVNDHGTVVGSFTDTSFRTSAFIWDERSGMRKLLDAPSIATAINNRGDIIGTLAPGQSFLLSDGVLTRLDLLPALQAAGFTQFMPEEINERGWIVGSAFGPTVGGRAVLLIPGKP